MEILRDLIGKELAEKCMTEIKDRSRPDDPDYFQSELRSVIIQKYISKKEITLTELSLFIDKHGERLRLETASMHISDLTKTVMQRITHAISETIKL